MPRLARLTAILIALVLLVPAAPVRAAERLEVGYMPILPVSQLFVALEEGWLEEAAIEPDLVEFQNGPAMVQALLAGQLDVAYFGIGPAMVTRGRGADIKVVASNIVEQISIVALGDLAPYFESGPAETAFARFTAETGRKPVISTFPRGSVPETVLQFWLRRQLGIDPDQIEIVFQGAAQVQQSLLTEAVDGAAILEPVVTIVSERRPDARVVAAGSELFPDQPGAVLAVREGLIARAPKSVEALVAAHERATRLLREDPARAARSVARWVGGGRLDLAIVEKAIRRTGPSFVADPGEIIAATKVMHDFQAEIGTLKQPVDLDALFETRFYDAATGK